MIKGYVVASGFMGYVQSGYSGSGHYMLFATEGDYLDYISEDKNEREIDESYCTHS